MMGEKSLRRYTGLVAAIQMLRMKTLTLLSPRQWDDKNDAHTLERYREAQSAGRVLVTCLTEHFETYHHWKIYAPGAEGVCIEFDKAKLINNFAGKPGFKFGLVEYMTIEKLKGAQIEIEKLPFLKRFPYCDENEYRIVFTDNKKEPYQQFPIDLGCIRRVNLSPWMPASLDDSIRQTIRAISGCRDVPINRSQLVDYKAWKSHVDKACGAPFRSGQFSPALP